MNNYKGFDIEETQSGALILWFSDRFGDNRIFDKMKEFKIILKSI